MSKKNRNRVVPSEEITVVEGAPEVLVEEPTVVATALIPEIELTQEVLPEPINSMIPLEVPKARLKRDDFVAILSNLYGEYGSKPIPLIVLQERGMSPSAWTHQPYWKGHNPGAKACFDLELVGSLHKTKGGTFLILKSAAAKAEIDVEDIRKTA
jgi:hypothetical protein